MRRVLALVLLLASALWSTSFVGAEDLPGPPAAGGGISQATLFVGIIAPGAAGSSGPISAGDPAAPRPYTYTWVPVQGTPLPSGAICDAFGTVGTWYGLVIRDLDGAVIGTEPRCVPVEPDGTPVLPELPPVPTIGDIWAAALREITRPALGINPRPTGLTGLETWLWYEGPSELGVSTGIGAFTVTGTAYLREVSFDMGDGDPVSATTPGSAEALAARHVYETKGTYEVVITATWEADLVLAGPGLPARPTPIGSAVLRSSESYPVQEVRGLLVD